jgi:hypothetical protein
MRTVRARESDGNVEGETVIYYDNDPATSETYYQSCDFNDGAVFHRMTGELDETYEKYMNSFKIKPLFLPYSWRLSARDLSS